MVRYHKCLARHVRRGARWRFGRTCSSQPKRLLPRPQRRPVCHGARMPWSESRHEQTLTRGSKGWDRRPVVGSVRGSRITSARIAATASASPIPITSTTRSKGLRRPFSARPRSLCPFADRGSIASAVRAASATARGSPLAMASAARLAWIEAKGAPGWSSNARYPRSASSSALRAWARRLGRRSLDSWSHRSSTSAVWTIDRAISMLHRHRTSDRRRSREHFRPSPTTQPDRLTPVHRLARR